MTSIAKQIERSYSATRASAKASRLVAYGIQPASRMVDALDTHSVHWRQWQMDVVETPLLEHFPEGQRDALVYLSADSDTTITQLEPGKIYIVGAIVDRNRHKGLCQRIATEHGIPTAKLPIGEHLHMLSRKVLTTNHGDGWR
ncbi:hypothetical protein CXG81DRAFT_20808 [Caulochytrium protostelioides]|uniref:tRNA (guanine(9)-N1)-methyltransferase n=1 Tax=Caulochytrium protostelioides TaxID=1555241 RepID=A0A4P9X235_9FUNG|nr:hypothetical protein CXG81DRAFT_20808 [Caulochytrium protostelioides]|eukprot:RKO99068.1 hypothetical protein CXG81DRAFT_20808 [Caulochytrium protostelioides]